MILKKGVVLSALAMRRSIRPDSFAAVMLNPLKKRKEFLQGSVRGRL